MLRTERLGSRGPETPKGSRRGLSAADTCLAAEAAAGAQPAGLHSIGQEAAAGLRAARVLLAAQ